MKAKMLNLQDLPDEVILKILSYQRAKELISCGQVSKRIRRISRDNSLWVIVNLEKKTVKTEFLEMILRNGCRVLKLGDSTILGSLSSNMKSQLRCLNLSQLNGAWSDQEDPVVENTNPSIQIQIPGFGRVSSFMPEFSS